MSEGGEEEKQYVGVYPLAVFIGTWDVAGAMPGLDIDLASWIIQSTNEY